MRFKTTSVLERPTSPKTPPSVGGAKLKRAATMVARPHTFHGHSPPPSAFSRDKPRMPGSPFLEVLLTLTASKCGFVFLGGARGKVKWDDMER